jgi:hypothetical protein
MKTVSLISCKWIQVNLLKGLCHEKNIFFEGYRYVL